MQTTDAKHDYVSFVTKTVACQTDGVWTTGTIQCLHEGILPSMTHTLPTDTILPNKSQSFSMVWTDNTDSICDLTSVMTYSDNHASNLHKADATRSSTTNRSVRRSSNGEDPLPPSHLIPLFHDLLSLPTIRPRIHLLIPQEFLRTSPLAQGTSSIVSQGQDLSISSANWSTRNVF